MTPTRTARHTDVISALDAALADRDPAAVAKCVDLLIDNARRNVMPKLFVNVDGHWYLTYWERRLPLPTGKRLNRAVMYARLNASDDALIASANPRPQLSRTLLRQLHQSLTDPDDGPRRTK